MPLVHRSIKSNDVRAPEVPRGEVVVVARYSEKTPKVALVNPDDLAMLEAAHGLLQAVGELDAIALDDLTRRMLDAEDRPASESLEDPAAIAELLGL